MTTQQAIKHLRAQLGLTQEGLARQMNLTLRTIARYESQSPPKGQALHRFLALAQDAGDRIAAEAFLSQMQDWVPKDLITRLNLIRSDLERLRQVLYRLDTLSGTAEPILTAEQIQKIRDEAVRLTYAIERRVREADPLKSNDTESTSLDSVPQNESA
jgi:transcriptional regulator with XRE-family HTH domain